MAEQETLLQLAERVEKLTGPDREVDALIQRALGERSPEHWFADLNGNWVTDDHAPAFTASLDAAMSLVPERARFYVDNGTLDGLGSHACVYRENPRRHSGGCKSAATPALALTAAALRARAGDEG